jgi:tyrosine-protein kinase Etk/Wzc
MEENFYTATQKDDIDFGKIFRVLMMQSKLIISIILTVFIISYIQYSFTPKKYLIQSLLYYETFNQNILDPSSSLQSSSSFSNVSNLTELYESRTNLLKVIEDLKLNIIIEDIEDEESIDIIIYSDEGNEFSSHILKFSFSENSYSLLDEELNEVYTSEYGKETKFNDLRVTINSVDLKEFRPLDIEYRNPKSMYSTLKQIIDVRTSNSSRNSFLANESLINVSYVSENIEEGKEIINYANDIFLSQRIYDETEKSRKAINFINQTIESIEDVVEANKIKLKDFREKNKSIDVSLEIEAILNKIEFLDESLNSIEIEINKSQEIYTPNNPAYLNILNKKKLIEKQKELVLLEIENMPKEQQEYIDLYNDVEVSQSLFEELESRRLGFSILEASTIGDIRIIDDAYVVYRVSPNMSTVFLSTIIAFVIACVIAIIRGLYFLPISNPAEIFDNNIHTPIIGVIPELDDFILSENNLRLTSSIESLIVNINSLQENQLDRKIITITSPSPNNGKSTVSMKLAEGMARINKKVLLVDNDLKRGKINKSYNLKNISKKTFNSINESTLDNFKITDNLYVIPRVKGLTNSFQFLFNNEYSDRINFFKEHFDYIIFDTGPILSVADSSILIEQSNFNILVARHQVNRINEIKQSVDNFKQINKNIDGIVYNAYSKPKSYYGYYGLYGNYSYQYYADKYLEDTYEYEE